MSRARTAAIEVVSALRGRGHVAYFAGGCVRDELLGETPEDYDVATDARPEAVRAIFPEVSEVGASFGVMLLRSRGVTTEIATFREESGYTDKRRPDAVRYSDAAHDARRRDFTINALFLDPLEAAREIRVRGASARVRGEVIDFVGGLGDLEAGMVRAVGDPERRLAEDHLRALRAVRFTARLGFRLDEGTAAAITAHARELEGVSHERVGDELRRMLGAASRGRAVELMTTLGLDGPALQDGLGPAADAPALVGRLEDGAGFELALAAWGAARLMEGAPETDVEERFAAARVEGLVGSWRRSLSLSNTERAAVQGALAGVGRLEREFAGAGVAGQKRMAGAGWFDAALTIYGLLKPEGASDVAARRRELEETPGGVAPAPLLDGADLLGLGASPGPAVGRALEAVYDLQLEGRVGTREEALEAARDVIAGGQKR